MTWMLPSAVSILIATLILASVFGYLHATYRERHLLYWCVACLFSSLRYVTLIGQVSLGKSALLANAYFILLLLGAGMMLLGAQTFTSRKPGGPWVWLYAGGLAWAVVGPWTGLSDPTVSIPVIFLLGASYLYVGAAFLRSWPRPRPASVTITATLFILWGIHQFDYPVLRFIPWFAPVGYLIGGTFALSTSIGVVMVYFERARRELATSKERYEELLHHLGTGVVVCERPAGERRWRILELNEAGRKFGGRSGEDPRGAYLDAVFPGVGRMGLLEISERVAKTGLAERHPLLELQDGDRSRWFNTFVYSLSSGELVCVFSEVTRKRLRESELLEYEQFVKNSLDDMVLLDREMRYRFANPAFLARGGRGGEVVGLSVRDVLGEEVFNRVKPAIDQAFLGQTVDFEMQQDYPGLGRRDVALRYFPVRGSGGIERVGAILRDVTELKQAMEENRLLEAQRTQSQKLESLGTLAGGIAHDFNNILTVVQGYGELIARRHPEGSDDRDEADTILQAAARAKDLVRGLLAFSRHGEEEKKLLLLSSAMREVYKMVRPTVPSTIRIECDIREVGCVCAAPPHLQQILMNLCTNAYQAMRETGGTMTLELAPAPMAEVAMADLPLGAYARILVTDTGKGMDVATKGRIFDPFFTTKAPGEGTGLGLSMVHGIVRDLNGAILVESEPGRGSRFSVLLPIAGEAADGECPAEEAAPVGNGEKVLVVDDEAPIARVAGAMLARAGFSVEVRTGSLAALEALRAGTFDLLLTDQTMPDMTGETLIRRAKALQPGLKAILVTGFSETVGEEQAREAGASGFLMKPFNNAALVGAARSALGLSGGCGG